MHIYTKIYFTLHPYYTFESSPIASSPSKSFLFIHTSKFILLVFKVKYKFPFCICIHFKFHINNFTLKILIALNSIRHKIRPTPKTSSFKIRLISWYRYQYLLKLNFQLLHRHLQLQSKYFYFSMLLLYFLFESHFY